MPRYVLKKLKREKTDSKSPMAANEWMRNISIPVNQAIVEALEVGEKVYVKLEGEVTGLSINKSDSSSSAEMRLEISAVEAYETEAESKSQREYEDWRRRDGGK